jgi:hypothetical protein
LRFFNLDSLLKGGVFLKRFSQNGKIL